MRSVAGSGYDRAPSRLGGRTHPHEGEQVVSVLDRLFESIRLPSEVLVIVDSPDDTTIPVTEQYGQKEPRLRCLVNTYGRGPANAIGFGIDAAKRPWSW